MTNSYFSKTMLDTNASYNESPDVGHRSIQDHRNDINCCIDNLKDILHDYVENEVLTPGEFVSCVKDALNDNIRHHNDRLKLLKDAESLLVNVQQPELLNEQEGQTRG